MLAPERQNEILNMLTQRGGVVKMTEIAKKFGVSNETIRRDLDFLQDQQLIRRVYGGAILAEQQSASSNRAVFSAARAKGQQERAAIGRLAAQQVHENETLLMGTGTTVLEVAKHLKHLRHLTILTNSLLVAQELSDTNFDIFLLGGKLDCNEMFTAGEIGLSALRGFFVDKTIIGAMVVSGMLCGLVGMFEVYGLKGNYQDGISKEYYFDGLLVAMIMRYKPAGIIAMSFAFAFLKVGAAGMELNAGVPGELYRIIQAVIIFFLAAENGVKALLAEKFRKAGGGNG